MAKTKAVRKRTPKKYELEMLFNGEKYKKSTDNIPEAILSFKPEFLHTELYVIVKEGKEVTDRRLNLVQGRKLFMNDDFLEVFINNLLLNAK